MNWPGDIENGIEADLRRRICMLELPPGAALSRSQLMGDYGVSSTPLRDALLQLQAEGLVEIHPQSRTMVSLIDLDHARQIHVMRNACEQEAAAVAARLHDPPLPCELSQIIELQVEAARNGDLAAFTRLDHAFHDTIFRHAQLEKVRRVLRRESGHIDRLRALHLMQPEKTVQIVADHTAVHDAIAAGDEAAARTAMRHHLSQSILISEKLREARPEYFNHSVQPSDRRPDPVA